MKMRWMLLQGVVIVLAVGALAFLLGEPHLEGRNVNASLFEIYFNDPFLAYAYVGSIPFFVGLAQAFKLLEYIGQGQAASPASLKALRIIKFCGLSMIAFVAGGEIIILLSESDDRAGGVVMGLLVAFCAAIVALSAAKLEAKWKQPQFGRHHA